MPVRPRGKSFTIDFWYQDHAGARKRYRQTSVANTLAAAKKEESLAREKLMKQAYMGPPPEAKPTLVFAVDHYLKNYKKGTPRDQTKERMLRLLAALKTMGKEEVRVDTIDQSFADAMKKALFGAKTPKASTIRTVLYTPLTAVLNHARRRKWCDKPDFDPLKIDAIEPLFFTPDEAWRLIEHAGPSLQPLLVFMFGTGCRLSEAIYLDWRQVDLDGCTVTFLESKTKAGKRRVAELYPTALAALRALDPQEAGPVFRNHMGLPYVAKEGHGGQIATAFANACERAGFEDRGFHPHCTRHSWATWQYAMHKDLLRLQREGGWATLTMAARYGNHLMPERHRLPAMAFWGIEAGPRAVDAGHHLVTAFQAQPNILIRSVR